MAKNYDVCPGCGEPVQKNWKVCPACETVLSRIICPQCGLAVKENWKRCPECETRLICPSCGSRISGGYSRCPQCQSNTIQKIDSESNFSDPIIGIEFVRVSGGLFMMGDTFDDGAENERPVHEVQLEDFYIGKYPVTQRQWQQVMNHNPSHFQGNLHPVEKVTWHDVQIFIDKLIVLNEDKLKYRLPSEAEWEYAARSCGGNERYAGGGNVDTVAWYAENADESTHPVGEKAPNGCGLYDMSGNAWEWCQDKYRENAYEFHLRENPVCLEGGLDRVIRGGSWNLDAWSVRCARRFGFPTDYYGPGLGFRLVRVI
ncbi:MAG: SUMF1/EgtB/PvdO family nonheme iron enzyme [Deltaproteobacteria bacterium]|nr:MAG: SUMF1/EgtB/PvdO family nonheme iron enzyme [Deltaproteobacteria bacterium]